MLAVLGARESSCSWRAAPARGPARGCAWLRAELAALACLEVAAAFGYLGALDGELRAKLEVVIGTLVRLVEGPRG